MKITQMWYQIACQVREFCDYFHKSFKSVEIDIYILPGLNLIVMNVIYKMASSLFSCILRNLY